MLQPRRRLLLSEIGRQCDFALRAYADSASAVERHDTDTFWYSLQALLGAAMQIHRFLEPDEELRGTLRIDEDSPLRRTELDSLMDMRTAFLGWAAGHPRGALREASFGEPENDGAAMRYDEFARFMDVEHSISVLFGKTYRLDALLTAVADLAPRVKNEMARLNQVM